MEKRSPFINRPRILHLITKPIIPVMFDTRFYGHDAGNDPFTTMVISVSTLPRSETILKYPSRSSGLVYTEPHVVHPPMGVCVRARVACAWARVACAWARGAWVCVRLDPGTWVCARVYVCTYA